MIDEIPDPPESESEGKYRDEGIRYIENWIPLLPSEEKYCEYHSESSSMEAHPSLPDLQNLNRMI